MKSKKGFEISLNMIIIVILALVFLGAAIFFITKFMPTEIGPIPSACDMYPPTADSPVCVNNQYEISRGATAKLEVSFYNDEDADIPSTVSPQINCGASTDGKTLALGVSAVGMQIPVGESKDFVIAVKVPKDAARTSYPCVLKLSNTEKQFLIVVE